jgi:choline dehydrogenase
MRTRKTRARIPRDCRAPTSNHHNVTALCHNATVLFDYIVVGAGTAGCTLAARLTENPSAHVLLIEAGPSQRRREISVPSAFPKLLGSSVDWKDATAPQQNLNGRRLAWLRGKGLGGSGSMGAMIHLRGCRADYDGWRDLGNPGWGFDDLAPLATDPPASTVAQPPNKLTEVFLEACEACGIRRYAGFSGPAFGGPEEEGAGLFQVARLNGARWDATDAFLNPALKRGNLTVWTGVQAAQVLLEDGRATGVEYLLRGSRHQVRGAREVILCAGAVGSAQLLLLSGVGPEEQLKRIGVPVASALTGVGENLQDHVAVALRWTCPQPVSLDGAGTPRNAFQYRLRKRGPLASNLIEAGAFLEWRKESAACDLEILFAPLYSLQRGLAPPAEQYGFTLLGALLTPKSRGRISLASADLLDPPQIDPCYLMEAEDKERLVQAAGRARGIVGSASFAPYRGAASGGAAASDDIEERVVSLNHAAGTCRMGQDQGAVVDSELRVHGVGGLRVADASVMPVIPRAHPNATVMMIAEKAARLIQAS